MRDFKAYSFPKNQFGDPEGNFEKVQSYSSINFRKSVYSKLELEQGSISSTFYEQLFHAKIPKVQKDWQLDCLFALLGSERKKTDHRMLMKLTPDRKEKVCLITLRSLIIFFISHFYGKQKIFRTWLDHFSVSNINTFIANKSLIFFPNDHINRKNVNCVAHGIHIIPVCKS